MSEITYKKLFGGHEAVFLDDKKVGVIAQIKTGWAYFSLGKRGFGEPFETIQEVKKSIEED